MIRVLHYVGKMDRGGMETLIMNLYRNIDRSKVQFDFAIHGVHNGDFEEEIIKMGGHFYNFPQMRKNPIKYRMSWKEFWNKHKDEYKVFHMHTNSLANIIAFEEAYKANIPIRIIHSHSSFANKGKLQFLNNYLHKLHRKKVEIIATNLITCSDKAAEWMFGGMKLGNKKVLLLKNGVDIEKFKYCKENRKKIRNQFGINDETKIIGQVGTFLPVKNHRFSIKLIKNLKDKNKNVKLMLVGDGILREKIEQKISDYGLEQDVLILGKRQDVESLLSAMDIYIMPSLYEGLPVSLIEAQVNGVPIIVSDTITQEIKLNDNVKYLPIDNGTFIWSKEIELLECIHKANIKQIIEKGFDIKQTCEIYMNIIQK